VLQLQTAAVQVASSACLSSTGCEQEAAHTAAMLPLLEQVRGRRVGTVVIASNQLTQLTQWTAYFAYGSQAPQLQQCCAVPRAVKMAPARSQMRELLRPISIALAVDVMNPNGTR
jgi:hypothetical protein